MAPCLRLHNKNLSGKVAQFWDNWTIFSARLKIDIPGGNSASVETTRALNLHRNQSLIMSMSSSKLNNDFSIWLLL